MHRVRLAFSTCFHTFVIAAFPLLVLVSANIGLVPLDALSITRGLLATEGATGLALLVCWLASGDLAVAARWLSSVLLMLLAYIPFIQLVDGVGIHLAPRSGAVAGVYVIAALIAALLARRLLRRAHGLTTALNTIAVVLLVANFGIIARSSAWVTEPTWRATADEMIASAQPPAGTQVTSPKPDIYVIILDEFGRADVLRDYFELNIQPFVELLRSRGFYVPDKGHSDYPQTFPSLASTLNLVRLDRLAAVMGPAAQDLRPMRFLIEHNALVQMAKRAGYRVIGIGSDYATTSSIEGADECSCEQYGLGRYEILAAGLTPLAPLPFDRWGDEAHRKKVLDSLGALRRVNARPGPKMILAHIIAPHAPFVFGAHGEAVQPRPSSTIRDDRVFSGPREEYVRGYREQVQFVVKEMADLVGNLQGRPGAPPVILLFGDHGPASMLDSNDPAKTNMRERMANFAAYSMPGPTPPPLYPTISVLNANRILANRYLGGALPLLPEEAEFATLKRPYQFIPVELPN